MGVTITRSAAQALCLTHPRARPRPGESIGAFRLPQSVLQGRHPCRRGGAREGGEGWLLPAQKWAERQRQMLVIVPAKLLQVPISATRRESGDLRGARVRRDGRHLPRERVVRRIRYRPVLSF